MPKHASYLWHLFSRLKPCLLLLSRAPVGCDYAGLFLGTWFSLTDLRVCPPPMPHWLGSCSFIVSLDDSLNLFFNFIIVLAKLLSFQFGIIYIMLSVLSIK